MNQTVTRAAEADVEAEKIYRVLSDAGNVPKWAPVFADAIESVGDGQYQVMKSGNVFRIGVFLHPSALAVDFLLEMGDGRRGGAYVRVMPRPAGGSTITITVPVGPNSTEADVAKTAEDELQALIRLASE